MRKGRPQQVTLRLDSHVALYLIQMPGDNPADKIRRLVDDGIEYRARVKEILTKTMASQAPAEGQ